MKPSERQHAFKVLLKRSSDRGLCREVEAAIHSTACSRDEYNDLVKRTCFNIHLNGSLTDPQRIVHGTDDDLAKGTVIERMHHDARLRRMRFQCMLEEKYEALDDKSYEALVKCRRCGSAEISWEEKQTRSADEAATLFCVCTSCKNRWVMS